MHWCSAGGLERYVLEALDFESDHWEAANGFLPRGIRIYAVGDIHGRADLLRILLLEIIADLGRDPVHSPIIVFLGDYLDRGPRSSEVINLILAAQRQLVTVCLSGNHELYALRFLRDPSTGPSWFDVGGRETLASYGVSVPWRPTSRALEEASNAFATALPYEHFRFLATLGLTVNFGDYLFVHAGVQPQLPLAEQGQATLTLIREPFLEHLEDFGRIIIHGHTPVAAPDIRSNRINIDTGAYMTGRLTCLVLENERIRTLRLSSETPSTQSVGP